MRKGYRLLFNGDNLMIKSIIISYRNISKMGKVVSAVANFATNVVVSMA